MHLPIYMHTHMYIGIYIYICKCRCIYVYIYIYIYIYEWILFKANCLLPMVSLVTPTRFQLETPLFCLDAHLWPSCLPECGRALCMYGWLQRCQEIAPSPQHATQNALGRHAAVRRANRGMISAKR